MAETEKPAPKTIKLGHLTADTETLGRIYEIFMGAAERAEKSPMLKVIERLQRMDEDSKKED